MQRAHRAAHRRIWIVLAILIPAILIGAMLVRQANPENEPAVRLAPPSTGAAGQ